MTTSRRITARRWTCWKTGTAGTMVDTHMMTPTTVQASLETPADRRRYVRRLVVMHLVSLIACAVCIAVATWVVHLGIASRGESSSSFLASMIVTGLVAFFCLRGATNSQAGMIDYWRDFRRPLPPIDGSEVVLVRKRGNRSWPTLFHFVWLAGWTYFVASKWPDPWAVALGGFFVIIPSIMALKALWFPKVNDWAPLVIDGEGFEDRSGSNGRMGWGEVAAVEWKGGSVAIRLATPQPIVRKGLRDFFADLLGLPQNIETIEVHGHGFRPDHHRAFRILQAYWRYSRQTRSAAAMAAETVTRSAR
jgi:hypothetical protein